MAVFDTINKYTSVLLRLEDLTLSQTYHVLETRIVSTKWGDRLVLKLKDLDSEVMLPQRYTELATVDQLDEQIHKEGLCLTTVKTGAYINAKFSPF